MKAPNLSHKSGFTIVELMIATSVFSVVLLLLTFGLLSIGRVYYKGTVSVRTQAAARQILEDVVQNVEYGGGTVETSTLTTVNSATHQGKLCIGNNKYSFELNKQIKDASVDHAFVSERITNNNCTPSADVTIAPGEANKKEELIPSQMRLAKFEVNSVGAKLYEIKVKVIFGPDDLLIDAGNNKGGTIPFDVKTAQCKGGVGDQFCAVSELFTNAVKRIQ